MKVADQQAAAEEKRNGQRNNLKGKFFNDIKTIKYIPIIPPQNAYTELPLSTPVNSSSPSMFFQPDSPLLGL
jgi:hypothetical protein